MKCIDLLVSDEPKERMAGFFRTENKTIRLVL